MPRGIKLPESPSEWGFKGENYLLTIGIDKYAHWKPLNNAVKDVQDITRILTQRYQFEPDHVITLLDDEATEDNIRKKLLDVKKSITSEDNLIVFYSGHGHYDTDLDEGYWVPANARKDHPSDYISNSDVLKWIRAIKTHHKLVMVDSCFSGTLVSQSRSEVLSEKYPSSRIFASGRKELVDDGAPGTNSPFAKAILSRLTHNTDRVMRTSELIQDVTKVVESEAGQAPIEGRIKDAGDEGGEFVFHLKVTEDEIWASVVDVHTAEEFEKYIEYFPDGKYILEARTKLSALTDEKDWKRALKISTPAALAAYLEAHPRGVHYEDAFHRLEEAEENEGWQSAKTRNTVSAYMEYLRKYPSGRFEVLARKNLEGLKDALQQHEQDLMKDELADIEDTTTTSVDAKTQYKNLLNAAEGLYAEMSYEACIEKYSAALKLYKSHFVPDRKFIEQRINESQKRVNYLELVEDGKEAVTDGNYELALQFFRKARTIDDTMKIREWITHAEKKLKGDYQFSPVGPGQKPVPEKKKKKSKAGCTLTIVLSMIIAITGIGYLVFQEELFNPAASTEQDYQTYEDYQTTDDEYIPGPETSAQRPAALLPGTWNVTDRVIGGVSAYETGYLIAASWVFYPNGSLTYWENGVSFSGTWSVQDNGVSFTSTVVIPSLNIRGYIYRIDQANMVLSTSEALGEVTNYLMRAQ